MNKNNIAKIIKDLRKSGNNKDADFLQKSLNGEYNETYYGLRIAQLDDTPFVPVRKKLKVYDAQLPKEKSWLRGKLPLSEQHRTKFLKDPRVQSEIEGLGGDEPLSYGMPYRDPSSIQRTSDPDEMISRIRERGWPPHGLTTPFGRVLDVDPKHPVESVGARGGITYGDEFDFNEGAGIGFMPDDSSEFVYDQQENLDPGLVDMIQKVWGEGKDQFAINVESAIDRFNSRLHNWMTDKENQMLSTNFMTQINQVVTGYRDANIVWDSNIGGENLAAVIIKRMQNVQETRDAIIKRAVESEKYSDLQASLYNEYIDDLNSGLNYPSEQWLNKLMLVYGHDPRKGEDSKSYIMDIIADNPLEINYPQSFVENIILPYIETKRKSSDRGESGSKKELTWSDILSRSFRPVTVGGEETASRRKMIEDVDIWKGLVGSGGKPLISSQKDVLIFQYNQELSHLLELLKDLQRLLNVKNRFVSSKLDDARSNPAMVEEMHKSMVKFARTLENHYKQGEISTIEGKLMGSYSVGSETKLEIYLKALYIVQAYEAWSSAIGRGFSEEPIESVVGPEEPEYLKDIERIEADESMMPKSSFSNQDMVRIANILDKFGMSKLVDKLISK